MARAALITGAARRIGRALALSFARAGWGVGLHYHRSGREARAAEAEIAALGAAVARYRADLEDPAACARLVTRFRRDFPDGALLINSASLFRRDRIADLDPALWQRHLTVNALAPALLTRAFVEERAGPACVINLLDQKVSSLTPDFFSYTVSKVALAAITRMLAMELAPDVRVNAIAPGLVLPSGGQSAAGFARAHVANPLETGPTVEEICRAAHLIAQSPSMTGQVITIDGGRHLMGAIPPYDDLPKE